MRLERSEKSGTHDEDIPAAELNTRLGAILDKLGEPMARAAYSTFLADVGLPAEASPPWPLRWFLKNWTRYQGADHPKLNGGKPNPYAGRLLKPGEDPYAGIEDFEPDRR